MFEKNRGGDILQKKFEKSAVKYLKGLQKSQRDLILSATDGLMLTPPVGDTKKLEGYRDGRHRLRVGKYRVIYRYGNDNGVDTLFIMDVGSRGDIYK
jgi:mRNA interferase RelE/StbE